MTNPLSLIDQFMLNAAFHQHQQHGHLNPTPNNLLVPEQLSPAAQAVLTAFAEASDGEYVDGEWQQDDAGQLAAAIRAASARMMRLCYDSVNSKYLEGVEASSDLLDQIATELEAL